MVQRLARRRRSAAPWPTPRAHERQQQNSRDRYVALSLAIREPNGPCPGLNPCWVEALMGFPIGWTELQTSLPGVL
jgi:hypothetical protein